MPVSAASMAGVFAERLGPDRLVVDPAALSAAAIDGCTPRWIVRPATVDHVAAVLAIAWDENLAVAPRGAGTALGLGALPSRLDVVLDLTALDHVLEDNPDDLTVSVEAGITAGALADRLGGRRQWLPIDPPGWRRRTLGGMTATNAAGPLRARYGTLRDLVLGVRFVQADGVVTWGGARVVKSVTGYDVPKLMVGALGTLGVLAELTLRLHPLPDAERSWLVLFENARSAQALAERVVDSALQPSRLELFNARALQLVSAEFAGAGVAISIGSVDAAVREQGERLSALARSSTGRVVPLPEGFWGAAESAMAPNESAAVLHVATLADRLAGTIGAIEDAFGIVAPHADVRLAGCAPLGTLRAVVAGATAAETAAVTARIRALVDEVGGSVVVARGPFELRRAIDPWGPVEPQALALMRALRDEFDPGRVLNPGRYVGGL